jgi:hypothetical protein
MGIGTTNRLIECGLGFKISMCIDWVTRCWETGFVTHFLSSALTPFAFDSSRLK